MSDDMPQPACGAHLRTVALPRDANASGDIFGGWTLSQMDLAGGTFAAAHSAKRAVTVRIDAVEFLKPVAVALHHQHDVVGVRRDAGIGIVHERTQVGLDLVPYLQERLPKRLRVFLPEDRCVAIIVEQRLFRSPDDEHRLVRLQHDDDQRSQGLRPGGERT